MYSRVKLQLCIIYTVVRILNKSNQTFSVCLVWQQETAASANRRAAPARARQQMLRPAGAQAIRPKILGPAMQPIEHLRMKASERSNAKAEPMKPAMQAMHVRHEALRPAPIAKPLGNAHGAGSTRAMGTAEAAQPFPRHTAVSCMDQQPQPLQCRLAPSSIGTMSATSQRPARPATLVRTGEGAALTTRARVHP
jgi:hypothetical protein